jgi:hypothetical protein
MIGGHISGIYYNLLFGRFRNYYPSMTPTECFPFQGLFTDHPPSILDMEIGCHLPTEDEEATYDRDVSLGCEVITNRRKCLADGY